MTDLKTLKDLFREFESIYFCKDELDFTIAEMKSRLRAEAIKRAKHFKERIEKLFDDDTCSSVLNKINHGYLKGRYDEVMEANNLTEEELK